MAKVKDKAFWQKKRRFHTAGAIQTTRNALHKVGVSGPNPLKRSRAGKRVKKL